MYSAQAGHILAFHGCDSTVASRVIAGDDRLSESRNTYDWLGNGIYFWENDVERALQWAAQSRRVDSPGVVGVVLDLGHCLNLLNAACIEEVGAANELLDEHVWTDGVERPSNRSGGSATDPLIRDLDCTVIETLHELRADEGFDPYQSVRGMFPKGEELYPGAGFRSKNHIQICVCDVSCIKGYFHPLG